MDGNFFFVLGIVLVVAAVALAFLGIRAGDRFPGSRVVLVGVTAIFAAVVVATMAFAVVKSQDEQKERNEKLAKEQEQAQPENGGGAQPAQPTGGAATESLDVTSPADGGLSYEPNGLTAKPGNVTITYDNPSQVPHSIAVATANGNVLGEVQPFTNGKQSVDLSNLAPGKYVFYCTVPGHREAGMEGNLTVTGGPTP
ncbi:MAG TPA: cupredoxin domain-containing protein [Solirubrobacterales bacterium]|jgi:plastocyanin